MTQDKSIEQVCTCKKDWEGEPLIGGYAGCPVHDPNINKEEAEGLIQSLKEMGAYKQPKPESPIPSPLSGLVEALEKANPYELGRDRIESSYSSGWERCRTKLRELIEAKLSLPLNELNFDIIWKWLIDFALAYHKHPIKDVANDASEWLSDRWKELLVSQPAPLSGTLEEKALKAYPVQMNSVHVNDETIAYDYNEELREAFIAGHNSQRSVQVLVDNFSVTEGLKNSISQLVTAAMVRVGIDVTDDQQQEFQDSSAEGLIDEVLDTFLNHALQQFNTSGEEKEQEPEDWDGVLTNAPVRVHPMTENYFKNWFTITKKK